MLLFSLSHSILTSGGFVINFNLVFLIWISSLFSIWICVYHLFFFNSREIERGRELVNPCVSLFLYF